MQATAYLRGIFKRELNLRTLRSFRHCQKLQFTTRSSGKYRTVLFSNSWESENLFFNSA